MRDFFGLPECSFGVENRTCNFCYRPKNNHSIYAGAAFVKFLRKIRTIPVVFYKRTGEKFCQEIPFMTIKITKWLQLCEPVEKYMDCGDKPGYFACNSVKKASGAEPAPDAFAKLTVFG